MDNSSSSHSQPSLKRVLGLSSLFAIAMGGVTSQSSFVTILHGAGMGGAPFFIALLLAFILMLCYVFSFLELSMMMPKAGGPGTYTTVAIGHFPAVILVLGGYLAVSVIGGAAELMLLERVLDNIFPGEFSHIGLILLALLTILNLLGINIFSSVQNIIVYVLLVAVLVIGFAGLEGVKPGGLAPAAFWQQLTSTNASIFSLMVLALWSFAGLEFVCPMVEETKRPKINLPKAMVIASVALIIVYGLIAFAGIRQLPSADLANSEIPHGLLVRSLFGKTGNFMILVFAITTCSCTSNAVIAGTSRMLYGMAHHKQLPPVFKRIHLRWGTPWFGILVLSILIAIPLMVYGKEGGFVFVMIISAATLWLMAYIIAHINVMVLRKKYPGFKRSFKTPLYPLPQVIGILGMGYAIWDNSPSPELAAKVYINTGLIVGLVTIYAFFWVKFKMKKSLFEAEPIGEAMAD